MIVMFTARRLKPGAWERFRRAWDPGKERPPGVEALATFQRLGAEPWAAGARAGIVAAGATLPAPRVSPIDRLSDRELEVALAAAEGGSPLDIGERLFRGTPRRSTASRLRSDQARPGLPSRALTSAPARDRASVQSVATINTLQHGSCLSAYG